MVTQGLCLTPGVVALLLNGSNFIFYNICGDPALANAGGEDLAAVQK